MIEILQTEHYRKWFDKLKDRNARVRIDIRIRRYEKMRKEKTSAWDAADHLKTEADMEAYLEAALEENDSGLIAAALGDIARAKGMTLIAKKTGLGRESLYKALSAQGNPELSTVLKVVKALGLQLQVRSGKSRKAA
jgi:probable addiction module antidote protein